jgi:ATP-binding cassette subfamily B protein
MAAVLMLVAGVMVVVLFRLAAAGQPLHHDFANKAAAVDGEIVDVIANMPLVLSFCGLGRECRRFDATVAREMEARRSSHFPVGAGRRDDRRRHPRLHAGPLRPACHARPRRCAGRRDAAFRKAVGGGGDVATLLLPHELRDHPEAGCLVRRGAPVELKHVSFSSPNGHAVFKCLDLRFEPGQRVGLVGLWRRQIKPDGADPALL